MSQESEIHMTIDNEGHVEIEVKNVKGPSCKALSAPYEEMFTVMEVTNKSDYTQPVIINHANTGRSKLS